MRSRSPPRRKCRPGARRPRRGVTRLCHMAQNELDTRLRQLPMPWMRLHARTPKRKRCARYRHVRGASAASRAELVFCERERTPCTRSSSRRAGAASEVRSPTGALLPSSRHTYSRIVFAIASTSVASHVTSTHPTNPQPAQASGNSRAVRTMATATVFVS